MPKIYNSVVELVGNTPLLRLQKIEYTKGLCASIYAKLEAFNPGGSAKDRVAKKMIEDAEKAGELKQGSVIIEPTSGNTGIGLCMIASQKGYRTIIVMPETMSEERKMLMKAYGGELVLTDGSLGMAGSIAKAKELANEFPNSFIPDQFSNPSNPLAHYETTGPEIWRDLDGKVDVFVAGVGTGGTLSGAGKYLRENNPQVKIIGVEPASSPVLSGGKSGAHKIQGIGAGFIPDALDTDIYDEIITISNEDAYLFAKELGQTEGFLAGISSGAALCGAVQIAKREEYRGKNIVVLFPDTGERYLSAGVF
ncbi:MAG: cysteine synthase A [Ruminococcaceae bacterium]|nr:cysteine synthase A [Oscillospiraceae bacterium]